MKFKFLLPGTHARWQSGGLEVMMKLARFVGELRPSEIITYVDREPGRRFLDDELKCPPADDDATWIFTTGIDLPMLFERLAGRRTAYFAQETGWELEMQPGVPILCATRFAMAYWAEHSPANPVYLLPVAVDPEVVNRGIRRDVDVLYLARKTTPYLQDELVPGLRKRCAVETVDRFIERPALIDLFNRTRVYLYDSSASFADGVVEGIGLQPLEALVCGCTVFSNLEGGMSDYLDPGVNFHRLELRPDRDVRAILDEIERYDASRNRRTGNALAAEFSEENLRLRLSRVLPLIESLPDAAADPERGRQRERSRVARQKASQPLYREIRDRGRVIDQLRSELGLKVGERDRTIRALQREMDNNVRSRDETIRLLQRSAADAALAHRAQLQGIRSELALERANVDIARGELRWIYGSRVWRVATRYWSISGRLSRLFRGKSAPSAPGPSVPVAAEPGPETRPSPENLIAQTEREALLLDQAPIAADNRHDVVCLPIIDWDFRFQRPQQLMTRFAEAGHRVFYVSQRFRRSGAPWEIRRVRENIYEVSLRGPARNVYRDTLDEAACAELFDSLDALRRDLGLGATAAIVQLPFWWPLALRARGRLAWPVVYDCMDHHAGFSTNREAMLALEDDLLRSADLVVASSAPLADEARRANDRVVLVRNGCDYPHFNAAFSSREPGARPVVGYYGAIADWFDSDLVADLATARPGWDFILVGSTFSADVSRLAKLPNVSLPGEKPYAEIPGWLARFDVAIIPFKQVPLTKATNPVKAYEIFAAGKPLVAVPLPEIAAMAPHVRLGSTAEEFAREIESAMAAPGKGAAERAAFARNNTWKTRFETLAPAVSGSFPKVSVIVVTFGNLDLNRLCLASLLERSEWPNLEVVVVDNASDDGTPGYLRETSAADPRVRALFNDANLGFAAANNQGLRAATGDFLVLLNNDTIVRRGWLPALIRHLVRDPAIGLLGAVTNAIGNEAMIPTGYETVEDMPRWAARYVREHDGETFEIPMLAMFCVAMRRQIWDKVGPLDERFGVGMFEDDDYSRRVRGAGFRIVCARDVFVHHWMKASFKKMPVEDYQRLFDTNRRLFEEKWKTVWTPHGTPASPDAAS